MENTLCVGASVGDNFTFIRRMLNLTQAELATELGVGSTYVSMLENNKRHPGTALIRRLSDLIDVPFPFVSWFLFNHEAGSDADDISSRIQDLIVRKSMAWGYRIYKSEHEDVCS